MKIFYEMSGYAAWEDERKIRRQPMWGCIGLILFAVFACGATSGGFSLWYNNREIIADDELAMVVEEATSEALPIASPTSGGFVALVSTPYPTSTTMPGMEIIATAETEPLAPAATVTAETILATATITPTSQPVCGDALWLYAQQDETLIITFEGVGALRLLSEPRRGGDNPQLIQRLLYKGDRLTVLGAPECGSWSGSSVWYYPVRSARFNERGWVGIGNNDELWVRLENVATD